MKNKILQMGGATYTGANQDGMQKLMIAGIRYYDIMVKQNEL